jgi:hypothetical protein
VHWGCYYATALDIEVDPQRCGLGSCQSDFALQAVVECRALELGNSQRPPFILNNWPPAVSRIKSSHDQAQDVDLSVTLSFSREAGCPVVYLADLPTD